MCQAAKQPGPRCGAGVPEMCKPLAPALQEMTAMCVVDILTIQRTKCRNGTEKEMVN